MKRGDTQIEPLVVISIAIAVFAIAGLAGYLYFNDQINFFNFLPGFNITKDPQKDIEIIRYRLFYEEGKKYALESSYDGNTWIDLKYVDVDGKPYIPIGGKFLNGEEFERSIINYYYKRIPAEIKFESNGERIARVESLLRLPAFRFDDKKFYDYMIVSFGNDYFVIDSEENIYQPVFGDRITAGSFDRITFSNWKIKIDEIPKGISQINQDVLRNLRDTEFDASPILKLVLSDENTYYDIGNGYSYKFNHDNPSSSNDRFEVYFRIYRDNVPTEVFFRIVYKYEMPDSYTVNSEILDYSIVISSSFSSGNLPDYANSIRDSAVEWKHSVLATPIKVNYLDAKTKKEMSGEYCVKRIRNYLVIDLGTKYDGRCPIYVR